MNTEQRDLLEGDLTFKRVFELELNPVRGNFDIPHLLEVNRRIFQDLPDAGLVDVEPGKFRAPVPDGKDWMKNRSLSTFQGSFFVAYSRMDESALDRLDSALTGAKPAELRSLSPKDFSNRLADLYTVLDYVHPFSDGNSRTLRSFTAQLANESGYELDWEKIGNNPVDRDLLYIARDRGVNELAKPLIQREQTMLRIANTQRQIGAMPEYRTLNDLLGEAIRPNRAVAFERLEEKDALKVHPELKEAFKTMHSASEYFMAKAANKPETQRAGLLAVKVHIQTRLDVGEVSHFGIAASPLTKERTALPSRAPVGKKFPERER